MDPRRIAHVFRGGPSERLRDDIWEKLILEARNFVFEAELALLQARKPELIPFHGRFQRNDGFVKISVLLPELR